MKIIKYVICFILFIIISGCTVNYEIDINYDKVTEKLNIIENNPLIYNHVYEDGSTMKSEFGKIVSGNEFEVKDYKAKIIDDNDKVGLDYVRSVSNEISLSLLNQCYSNYSISNEGDVITIDSGNDFHCYDYYNSIESIEVVIKTNNKVINSNADYVSGKKYIWNITPDGNKRINIVYKQKDKSNGIIAIVLVTCSILAFAIICLIYNKRVKNNSI